MNVGLLIFFKIYWLHDIPLIIFKSTSTSTDVRTYQWRTWSKSPNKIFFHLHYAIFSKYESYGAIHCDMDLSTCTCALRHECKYWGTCADVKYTSTRSVYNHRRRYTQSEVKISKKRWGVITPVLRTYVITT